MIRHINRQTEITYHKCLMSFLLIVYLAPDPDQNQLFTIRGWIDGVVKHLELKGLILSTSLFVKIKE